MNRNPWALVAAVAAALAVLAVLIGVSMLSKVGRTAGPPASQREAFGFDAADADPGPMVLVVRYGDSGSCPSLDVRHDVVEHPDRVVVTLTRTPMATDRACTSDYGAKPVRVTLTTRLRDRGGRRVPQEACTDLDRHPTLRLIHSW